jgi:ammonia channel protein AmtB
MVWRRLGMLLVVGGCWCATWPEGARAAEEGALTAAQLSLLPQVLTWLLPIGVALVAVGLSSPARAQQVATALPLALALSLGGYYVCGFAFHWGGVGLVSKDPALAALVAEWSPLDLRLGAGWGMIGLRGFAPNPAQVSEGVLGLLLSQLALVTTATLIPLLALHGRMPRLPSVLLGLAVSCVSYPLVGNWVRGGGWLAQLGSTLRLGHGFVDYGFSSLFLVGGSAALAGLLAFKPLGLAQPLRPAPELPPAYLPLNVLSGAFLALLGWLMMILAQPLAPVAAQPAVVLLNALLAVGGAALGTLLYGWFVQSDFDAALTGRGILAALVAVGAGAPWFSPATAALLGGVCGLLLGPLMYGVERLLEVQDHSAAVTVHGLAALGGLLVAGALAYGEASLGQLYAQVIGVGAIVFVSITVPWALLTLLAQAYTLPPVLRETMRQRALQLTQERQARLRLRRQGGGLSWVQKTLLGYFRRTAFTERRLLSRARLAGRVRLVAARPALTARRGPPRR